MQFTEDELREYMEIWSSEFHETINLDEARASASALMELFAFLAHFGPEEPAIPSEP